MIQFRIYEGTAFPFEGTGIYKHIYMNTFWGVGNNVDNTPWHILLTTATKIQVSSAIASHDFLPSNKMIS